jgi:hypothetical protein
MAVSIISYTGELFRADEDIGSTPIGETAVAHYPANYTHQFFTLTNGETSSYRDKGVRHTKTWEVNQATPLLLLNILDADTRSWVLSELNSNNSRRALHIAFPVRNNAVYRRSNSTTVNVDRNILNIMCGLTLPDGRQIDGYYMAQQKNLPARFIQNEYSNIPISKFHSEVGLCRRAFDKITLRHIKRTYVPHMNRRSKTRKQKNNNNRSRSPRRAATASASTFHSPPRAAAASALSLNNLNQRYDSPPRSTRGLF